MDSSKSKPARKKVLLMGKSGSGKSSMRNIIFSNYVAKDVRRLGATIDVEHSQIKFLGSLVLNLWDCGGQDAFTETYLTTQKTNIFSGVGVLIYVFDVESRSLESPSSPDLSTYSSIVNALAQHSPDARVFCLLHKMDLVEPNHRSTIFESRSRAIRMSSGRFKNVVMTYTTSIWDESLYKAWGSIVHTLTPNLETIEGYLQTLAREVKAEEVVLFERATFLTVTSVTNLRSVKGVEGEEVIPYKDRFEKLSSLVKTFKHSLLNYTSNTSSSHPFSEFTIKTPRFNLVLARLTGNAYVLVVLPPGEVDMNITRLNIMVARDDFARIDGATGGKLRDTDARTDGIRDSTNGNK